MNPLPIAIAAFASIFGGARAGLIATMAVLVLGLLGISAIPTPAADGIAAAGPADTGRLEGRWIRLDGGYVLDLRFGPDGNIKAAYFNPRPIRVGKAELRRKDGGVTVYVELRDANYPGSAYTLRHDPKTDRLRGTYFQAVERQTYDIEFVRAP